MSQKTNIDLWKRYLYQEHSIEELKDWSKKLKKFRYLRASGGHANDGDSLILIYKYNSEEDLLNFFKVIGIELKRYDKKPLQPEPGVSYRGDIYNSFPSLISGTNNLEQPNNCKIETIDVFIWCGNGKIKISANPKSYIVTKDHVKNGEKLEKILEKVEHEIIDPPRDNNHCICPKYYPSFFE